MSALAILVAAAVAAAEPIPSSVYAESAAAMALLQAVDRPVACVEVVWRRPGRVLAVESSEDVLTWTEAPFRVRSEAAGRTALDVGPLVARAIRVRTTGEVADLRLLTAAGTVAVRVSGFAVRAGETEATVEFRTSLPVASDLLYGADPASLRQAGAHSPERRSAHAVLLSDLWPGTEYIVWVLTGPGAAVGASRDGPFRFKTAGRPYPVVTATEVLERTPETVRLRLRTNVPSRARLAWGDPLDRVLTSDRLSRTHVFAVDGLLPREEYAYRVVLYDAESRAMTMPPGAVSTAEANAALGAKVEGTFTEATEGMTSGPLLPRVTDGRLDYFEGMATSGDPAETDQWVRLDLGRPRVLEEVEVVWRGNAYPRSFFVSLAGADGEPWIPGGPYDAGEGSTSRSDRGDPLRHVRIEVDPRPVRFITITALRGAPILGRHGWNFVQLAEVKAHLRPGRER